MASSCKTSNDRAAGFLIYDGPLHDRLARLLQPPPPVRPELVVLRTEPRRDRELLPPDREAEIVAILERGPQAGETIEIAFRRKEADLLAVFAELSPRQARVLRERLTKPEPADRLASRFTRLVQERRERLLAFLGDAPRRAARTQPR